MSTHYLIDAHTSPISGSDINEARYNVTQSPLMGNFVVRLSDSMTLPQEPSSLTSLLSAKYQAVLAYYATYLHIAFEDFTDTPSVDMTNSTNVISGDRGTTRVNGGTVAGVLRTTTTALGLTPDQVIVTWEAFRVVSTDVKTDRLTRIYDELPSIDLTAEISMNNGATWTTVTDGAPTNIAVPDQGTNLVLRFTNAALSENIHLGSWAVLY